MNRRLSRESWIEAALAAIADGGVAAVAVEPLAAALKTTKGSFYHHFADRKALVAAALEAWESRDTLGVFAVMDDLPDAETKLTGILAAGLKGRLGGAVDAVLAGSADPDPQVRRVVARVTRRRLDYTARLFEELGLEAAEARRRAVLAYTAYLGQHQLRRAAPRVELDDAYVAHVIATLLSRRSSRPEPPAPSPPASRPPRRGRGQSASRASR